MIKGLLLKGITEIIWWSFR